MKLPSPNARNGAAGLVMALGAAAAGVLLIDGAAALECALVENSGDTIRKTDAFNACPPSPQGKPWRWIPVEGTPPAFDPATQVLEDPTVLVEPARVVRSWAVRAKTAQEIDDEKTARVDALQDAIVKALCNHENRIRVLESRATVTEAQCKNGFKALL